MSVATVETWPTVTVVTPSLDQGRFIGDTVASVADQDYPHIEHLVLDAGSTDQTHDVLRALEAGQTRMSWTVAPDDGQSDAINRGFGRARGSIIAWLNADDVYRPGAVSAAVEALRAHPETGLVYGRGEVLDASGTVRGPFAGWEPFRLWRLIHGLDYILQPATFFRRGLFHALGGLDVTLNWSMDWDLWIRLAGAADVLALETVLAGAREHDEAKTATGGWARVRELQRLARRHAGIAWTPGVRLYALDTLHRALGARLPRALAAPARRAVVAMMARVGVGMRAHADGWLGPRGAITLPRRWGRATLTFESHAVPPAGVDVRLRADGADLGTLHLTGSGVAETLEVDLPPSATGDFVTVDVLTDHRFRPPPPSTDRRRLSILCREVARA